MLQTVPSSPGDSEVHYLRAGSLEGLTGNKPLRKMWASPKDRASYGVRQGDLIVAEGGDAGRSAFVPEVPADTIIQNSLHRVRFRGGDIRFLKYALDAIYFSGWLDVLCNKATFGHLTREKLAALSIPWPSDNQQRAIADFLDAETARIDALIAKKRRMRQLLKEQLASHIERVVWRGVRGIIPLMHLTPSDRQIMYGIVLPGPDVEDGVPIIKGGNVASGKLEPYQLARTTREIEANYVRSRIADGDVLYAIRGGIGDVAIASASITGANITQDVARVAPRADVDSRWIRYALESATARADALGRVVGATVRGINIWDLKRVRVPDVDPAEMRLRADELSEIERSINEIRQRLDQQTQLLSEHRQALITAAVTGELEVPGADPL